MKRVVIIQARMTSSRLPGKVMLPLGDKTVLGHVLERCLQIKGIDEVCCAIPVGNVHDVLVKEIQKYKVSLFRGSEKNVLERYYIAAKSLGADVIMRVTSDCPLINPDVCSRVVQEHFLEKAEYSCNNMPPSWPHGYDCEIFGMEQLEKCFLNATEDYDKEHVTPWMRRHCKVHNILNPNGNQYHVRVTLDTQEDYEMIKNMLKTK
jgi:spore coat polysaccharide biosynthesis protein SpsF (cytidylyltransferase family)